MFTSLFISLILPIQAHPISYDAWRQSPVSMVQATIDTAIIIGLPRIKMMDSSMNKKANCNDLQGEMVYSKNQREIFIREYIR